MKRISVYVENAHLTPSAYYRLTQYFCPRGSVIPGVRMHSALPDCIYRLWHRQGSFGRRFFSIPMYVLYVVNTCFFLLEDIVSMHDGVIIISRAIVPRRMPALHKYLLRRLAGKNKLIWDFDDNILDNRRISPSDFRFFSKHSDTIVVTGDFLKSLIDPLFAGKVIMLPTIDGNMLGYDRKETFLKRQQLYRHEIRLVWVATDSGLPYLSPLIPALDETAKTLEKETGRKLSLHVVCNKPLRAETSHLEIHNIRWEREVAKNEILSAHIGIMPLPDNNFTRGKGGFKLIQYMSAAMPVIASAVGFNNRVVTEDIGFLIREGSQEGTWNEAILKLSSDWDYYYGLSLNAKKRFDEHFPYAKNKAFWMDVTGQTIINTPQA